jgi:hypothetical protein
MGVNLIFYFIKKVKKNKKKKWVLIVFFLKLTRSPTNIDFLLGYIKLILFIFVKTQLIMDLESHSNNGSIY